MKTRWKKDVFVTDPDGVAMGGYDPVSYFAASGPLHGKSEHEVLWHGARFRFATEANRHTFVAQPTKYAPQFGGHCAFAVSFSDNDHAPTAPPGRPDLWTIVDGKLYLNTNGFAHYMFRWLGRAKRADETWMKRAA